MNLVVLGLHSPTHKIHKKHLMKFMSSLLFKFEYGLFFNDTLILTEITMRVMKKRFNSPLQDRLRMKIYENNKFFLSLKKNN